MIEIECCWFGINLKFVWVAMAVSCPEVMYGAYYPYLYGRAGPSRSFYQYERVSLIYLSWIRDHLLGILFPDFF